jgi:anti-anti-sigma factor
VPAARLETLLGSLQARFGRRHPHWVVDLTKSDYVDSRALGALLQILDQSSDAGALVALAVSSDRAALAFQVLGFKDRFHWFKSADEAQAFVTAEIARRAEADKGGSG